MVLDDTNRITIQLDDGTQVLLLGESIALSNERSNRYYYLPVNLRLSKRPDGTPEFLFLKFTTEKSAAQGGISGGLMHFLMEWGLTPQQEAELRAKLKTRKAELVGAVPLDEAGDGGSFRDHLRDAVRQGFDDVAGHSPARRRWCRAPELRQPRG